MSRIGLRVVALVYLTALLLVPVGVIFYRTFEPGPSFVWKSITTPAAISAFQLTLEVAALAVVVNTVCGVLAALALVRGRWRGKWLVEAFIDLPFAISPIVVGLALRLTFADRGGWIHLPFQVIFSFPGIVLATTFVTLPFVVREVAPVLRELGDEQEQAAATLGANGWQTFRRITLPAIRWGLAYGVVLTVARAIGEFGAVTIVSDKVAGSSQTLTLLVASRYDNLNLAGAYAASALLAVIAIATLLVMTVTRGADD